MKELLNILLALAPYLIMSFVFIYIFHEALRFIQKRDALLIQHKSSKANTVSGGAYHSETEVKLELNAAERFVLYLERIAPDRLVMRLHQNGMNAKMLQTEMLRTIREEFDHNLSQQIYVSENAWELIKNAKDEMIKFVSAIGSSMTDKNTGIDLSRKIFEKAGMVEKLPSDIALQYLRNEVRKLLGR